MKNNIDNILLAALFAVIAVGGIALYHINKSGGSHINSTAAATTTSSSLNTTAYKHPSAINNKGLNPSAAASYHNYDMPEPFAANAPFEFTPTAWMQMMNNMMNTMQMTQMMHQMAAMPTQMMNPTIWMNPHGMLPNQAASPAQQPMDPKEYKKWYEQQQKH